MSRSFDQAEYWLKRRDFIGDPRSVGHMGLSREQNLAGEAEIQKIIGEAAQLLKPARSVLDLGCGYGRIAHSFTDHGYEYLGVDISPEAIEQARARNPAARFEVGDLNSWTSPRCFDIVVALYVFVHFVEDARWISFVKRALSWVDAQGAFLFADYFPEQREQKVAHAVSRPFSAYDVLFAEAGFRLDRSLTERLHASSTFPKSCMTFRIGPCDQTKEWVNEPIQPKRGGLSSANSVARHFHIIRRI